MATPIGRILLMPKGDYSGSAVYNALDWVRYSGSAWVCTTDNTTGIAPAVGVTQWQLLASDGTVGGWSTLANKPFETVGKGLTVPSSGAEEGQLTVNVGTGLRINSSNKVVADTQNTYIPSSTGSDKPISGQGVKDALDTIQDGTTIDSFADVETALDGKAGKTEIIQWIDATLPSGSLSYNVSHSVFKTTSRIASVVADGGGKYSSIGITTNGVFTITFPSALTGSLNISIGISNATGESGTVS